MTRSAVLALGMGCVVALAACGEDHSSPPTARIGDGKANAARVGPGAASLTPPPSPAAEGAALDRRVAEAERSVRRNEAARTRRAVARARTDLETRTGRANAATARGAALQLAEAMGFGDAKATVSADGREVALSVPEHGACAAPVAGPGSLADGLYKALPFVRKVKLSVGAASLADYAAAHCAFAQLPAVRTVAAASGSGTAETEPFRVGRGRWVVDYGSSGTFVQVLLMQDAELLAGSAQHSGTATGQIPFTGPGTFTLRIAGDGPWAVQVRESGD
jgi:hypothetical protein